MHKEDALNLKIPENYIRLECVIRLLRQGYKPDKIELEKPYKLGHKYKGYADIIINMFSELRTSLSSFFYSLKILSESDDNTKNSNANNKKFKTSFNIDKKILKKIAYV